MTADPNCVTSIGAKLYLQGMRTGRHALANVDDGAGSLRRWVASIEEGVIVVAGNTSNFAIQQYPNMHYLRLARIRKNGTDAGERDHHAAGGGACKVQESVRDIGPRWRTCVLSDI